MANRISAPKHITWVICLILYLVALAYIPFVWMITEAQRCGLKFKSDYAGQPPSPAHMIADPDTFKNAIAKRDERASRLTPSLVSMSCSSAP